MVTMMRPPTLKMSETRLTTKRANVITRTRPTLTREETRPIMKKKNRIQTIMRTKLTQTTTIRTTIRTIQEPKMTPSFLNLSLPTTRMAQLMSLKWMRSFSNEV